MFWMFVIAAYVAFRTEHYVAGGVLTVLAILIAVSIVPKQQEPPDAQDQR